MNTKWIALACLAVFFSILGWSVLQDRGGSQTEGPLLTESDATQDLEPENSKTSTVLPDAVSSPSRHGLQEPSGPQEPVSIDEHSAELIGVVLAVGSEAPLSAKVRSGSRRASCRAEDGSFRIRGDSGVSWLEFSSEGYRTRRVELADEPAGALRILLTAESKATLRVVNEAGEPQAQVGVLTIRDSPRDLPLRLEDSVRLLGRTNASGVWTGNISERELIYAAMERRTSSVARVSESHDGELRLVLSSRDSTQIRFVTPMGEALEDRAWLLQPLASPLLKRVLCTTSANGGLGMPLPLGRYEVMSPMLSSEFVDERLTKLPGIARYALGSDEQFIQFVVAADGETHVVVVRDSDAAELLVVDEQGEVVSPFEAWAEVPRVPRVDNGNWDLSLFRGVQLGGDGDLASREWRRAEFRGAPPTWDGVLSLARFNVGSLDLGEYRIAVGASGFRSSYIVSPPLTAPGEQGRIILLRQKRECEMRVVDTDGSPYPQRITVRSSVNSTVFFDGFPRAGTGFLEPFKFDGPERLEIFRYSGALAVSSGHISSVEFEGGAIPTLTIDDSTSLLVTFETEAPDGLALLDGERRTYQGVAEAGGIHFVGLSPGDFALVTRTSRESLIMALLDHSLGMNRTPLKTLLPIHLESGERRTVELPDELMPLDVSGSVDFPDSLIGKVWLYPRYPGERLPADVKNAPRRLELTQHGEYRWRGVAPLPVLLTVVRSDRAGLLIPLGSFPPGENYSLEGAQLQVVPHGLRWYCATASFTFEGRLWFATGCAEGREDLSLGWVPAGETTIEITDGEDRSTSMQRVVPASGELSVDIQADAETRRSDW